MKIQARGGGDTPSEVSHRSGSPSLFLGQLMHWRWQCLAARIHHNVIIMHMVLRAEQIVNVTWSNIVIETEYHAPRWWYLLAQPYISVSCTVGFFNFMNHTVLAKPSEQLEEKFMMTCG